MSGKCNGSRSNRRSGFGPSISTFLPWSNEEDALLVDGFHAGRKLGELAIQHQRTAAGIQARLEKLGLVEPSTQAARWGSRMDRSGERA